MLKRYTNTIVASTIIIILFSISSFVILSSSLQAYEDRLVNNLDPIEIKKENGKKYVIDVNYIQDFNVPKVLKNNDAKEKKIAFKDQQEISNSNQVPVNLLSSTGLTGQPSDNREQDPTDPSVNASNVYVTWQSLVKKEVTRGGHDFPLTVLEISSSDVFFAASNDNGQTFGTPIKLNKFNASDSQIAVSGNNVYVTWEDGTPGRGDIFFAVSNDNGQTFGNPIKMSNNTGHSGFPPQIAALGNNVYVTWDEGPRDNKDIFFRASNDNGQTFGTPINVSNNFGESFISQIAASGNNVYVIWREGLFGGDGGIFFAASNDNGQTFDTPINVNTGRSFEPQIAAPGNNVYVTWDDDTPARDDDIFFAASNDNGQTFGNPINVSNNTGRSSVPQIAALGNNVYVTWEDDTPGRDDIFFAASNDNGQTFDTPINVSNNSQRYSSLPQIAASGNNVYVIWQDHPRPTFFEGVTGIGGFIITEVSPKIFFAASNDNGQTFGTPIDISSNPGKFPKIAALGNNVYVTWEDGRWKFLENLLLTNENDFSKILFTASNDNGQTFGTPINLTNTVPGLDVNQIIAR